MAFVTLGLPQLLIPLPYTRLHTALSVVCTALGDHTGHASEGDILQQALVAAIQTCQAYVATPLIVRTYFGNNTNAMVCYAGIFILKVGPQKPAVAVAQLTLDAATGTLERTRDSAGELHLQTPVADRQGDGRSGK